MGHGLTHTDMASYQWLAWYRRSLPFRKQSLSSPTVNPSIKDKSFHHRQACDEIPNNSARGWLQPISNGKQHRIAVPTWCKRGLEHVKCRLSRKPIIIISALDEDNCRFHFEVVVIPTKHKRSKAKYPPVTNIPMSRGRPGFNSLPGRQTYFMHFRKKLVLYRSKPFRTRMSKKAHISEPVPR